MVVCEPMTRIRPFRKSDLPAVEELVQKHFPRAVFATAGRAARGEVLARRQRHTRSPSPRQHYEGLGLRVVLEGGGVRNATERV